MGGAADRRQRGRAAATIAPQLFAPSRVIPDDWAGERPSKSVACVSK